MMEEPSLDLATVTVFFKDKHHTHTHRHRHLWDEAVLHVIALFTLCWTYEYISEIPQLLMRHSQQLKTPPFPPCTVRKLYWWRYCLALYMTKCSTNSLYLTKLYVTCRALRHQSNTAKSFLTEPGICYTPDLQPAEPLTINHLSHFAIPHYSWKMRDVSYAIYAAFPHILHSRWDPWCFLKLQVSSKPAAWPTGSLRSQWPVPWSLYHSRWNLV